VEVSVGDDRLLAQSAARPLRTTRTRSALYAALLGLLEERPFEQVTIREITARAGVGYATFFRHYPDKEALLHDLAERQISQLLAMTLPILVTVDSRATARALAAYVWEHRKLWSALLTGGAAGILRDEMVRQALEKAAAQQHTGVVIPADLKVVFLVAGVIEILAWWLRQAEPLSIGRMAEILDRMVIAPGVTWD
jgi:AcrR family transcriptional regulator